MAAVSEIIDLCGSDDEKAAEAPEQVQEHANPPWVLLGSMKSHVTVLTNNVQTLLERGPDVIIKQDPFKADFAIAVYGSPEGLPVGYLTQNVCAAFESLVTGNMVSLSATISERAVKRQRPVRDHPELCSVALAITISVRPALMPGVFRRLQDSGLPVMYEPGAYEHASQLTARKTVPSPGPPSKAKSGLLQLFDAALESVDKEAEQMEPSCLITTPMYGYQKAGLSWMARREKSDGNSGLQNVLWTKLKTANGDIYHNVLTDETRTNVPTGFKGGILADEMGLGKSLQIIALIVSNSSQGDGASTGPCSLGSTLIVCPVSVVSNWTNQIERHISPDAGVRTVLYHGPHRSTLNLDDVDIVITTYGTLTTDYRSVSPDKEDSTPPALFRKSWLRVVLDEAHVIRSRRSQQYSAALALQADRRWCLTGTPIQNQLDDLYSLLAFLRAEPLDGYASWSTIVLNPFKSGRPDAVRRVQSIIRALCLRRMKQVESSDIVLPKKTVRVLKVQMSKEERKLYSILLQTGREQLGRMLKSGILRGNYANVLEILLRMRMCCDHPCLVPSHMFDGDLPKSTQTADKHRSPVQVLLDVLRESGDEDCCYCLSSVVSPSITPCAHLFCRVCITEFVEQHGSCPVCNVKIDLGAVVDANAIQNEDSKQQAQAPAVVKEPALSADYVSCKVRRLLSMLNRFRREDSSIKSVIFSQWVSMLDLVVKPALEREGFSFVSLDGKMSRQQRDESIRNLGITLTAACKIFILDVWFNPGVEDQAIDRIHRVGQTRPVDVYRLVVQGSVEERILRLQDRKKEIMSQAISVKRTEKDVAEELRELLS
ncbi:hypothetical protein PBRA_001429 [Plasmodiophora brassicae]|uniref:RING-type domain-containing protein n=1 Tax=Plasmodiophora brassicae TaxID=37360 RepID=A0A0G4IYG4_PLABS|nr:hypothetical protein PBRA_001429 [Plasmodiophora brassicae]